MYLIIPFVSILTVFTSCSFIKEQCDRHALWITEWVDDVLYLILFSLEEWNLKQVVLNCKNFKSVLSLLSYLLRRLVVCWDTKASTPCLGGKEFPVFNLTFKWFNMMKPSPKSQGFIYKNQTQSAISDQRQQPSERGYEGRTGKAINCQSRHRSTSQSTTTITTAPLLLTCTLKHSNMQCCIFVCMLSSSLTRHNSELVRFF